MGSLKNFDAPEARAVRLSAMILNHMSDGGAVNIGKIVAENFEDSESPFIQLRQILDGRSGPVTGVVTRIRPNGKVQIWHADQPDNTLTLYDLADYRPAAIAAQWYNAALDAVANPPREDAEYLYAKVGEQEHGPTPLTAEVENDGTPVAELLAALFGMTKRAPGVELTVSENRDGTEYLFKNGDAAVTLLSNGTLTIDTQSHHSSELIALENQIAAAKELAAAALGLPGAVDEDSEADDEAVPHIRISKPFARNGGGHALGFSDREYQRALRLTQALAREIGGTATVTYGESQWTYKVISASQDLDGTDDQDAARRAAAARLFAAIEIPAHGFPAIATVSGIPGPITTTQLEKLLGLATNFSAGADGIPGVVTEAVPDRVLGLGNAGAPLIVAGLAITTQADIGVAVRHLVASHSLAPSLAAAYEELLKQELLESTYGSEDFLDSDPLAEY